MPVVAGVIILAQPIVELAFMRGEFDLTAATITARILLIYSFGMFGLSFAEILNREFYALKDTKSPVICSVVSIITNIILNFILVRRFGYIGLATATSVAATVLAVLLFMVLRRKIGPIGIGHLLINFVKMVVAVIVMAVVVFNLNSFLVSALGTGTMDRLITLIADVLAGAGLYFVLVYILKVKEALELFHLLKQILIKIRFSSIRKLGVS